MSNKNVEYLTIEDKIQNFNEKNLFLEYNDIFDLDRIDLYGFYEFVFMRNNEYPFELKGKENYVEGQYNSIIVNIKKEKSFSKIITRDLEELPEFEGQDFVITSPITYIGRNRNSNNARYCYGIAFDIDGVFLSNLQDLLHQMRTKRLPIANLIVNSGNGVHLYYLFEKPIALFDNIKVLLKDFKYKLTVEIWNMYTSSISEKQVQGIFQGFRLPGTKTKFGEIVTAFKFNDIPYATIEYLNNFIYEEKKRLTMDQIAMINKSTYRHSKISLEKAKELYPDWYERRIVKGEKRGKWNIKRDLYDWWLNKIKGNEVKEGHRYFCLMSLAMYAIKCNIDYEELKKDSYSLLAPMENLTMNEDNHFTKEDIEDSLKAFRENYSTFPRKDIEKITGIIIPPNKRNGRKQKEHLLRARILQNLDFPNGEWRNKNGKPIGEGTKENIVIEYKKNNPNATMYRCQKETGLSKNTVKKYWNLIEIEV
ncbi:hypothetical protein CEP89_00020 (plasmid) [Streptobacillus moniliformis]|uniref:Replication protein n=1 Tax=Streptobacillus moniliformis (strain ATCC 14647 / DSM 12112 / NCTC 10651 / 9901) TaxID=519441 RepID=D1AYW8_STRM9|nr:hypothetical protein [Streptobacillus moniliformis]ACZ01942.1 hypothetical protein Smon_1511 [Streptobacillus moniliformis DSM 12112]AVL42348.1 hypothetical protein CEP89_00020 [Streptobacillus moniliformis]SQA14932.1 Uncharacterised protein [Streptobacillus moniliformis]SQA14965.1 Uncharacterised protein [Streptobacillus moniliformis]